MRSLQFLKNIFFLLVILMLLPTGSAKAADEFSSSYDITYSVLEDGATDVTQNIQLKNLTDKFFPSSFSLIIPGSEVSDIIARDSQGNLGVEVAKEGSGTKLTIKFTNQQIIGVGKIYAFTLRMKDRGIAKNLGETWSIKIPKISQQTQVDASNLVLSVPTSFGDPDYVLPKPTRVAESGGRINFSFAGDEFFQSGISAIFGNSLNFSFESAYSLSNDSLFPKFVGIPIALNSSFQKTYIEKIEPRPENSEVDKSGNTIAFFKVSPAQTLDVKVSGSIQTNLNNLDKQFLNETQIQTYLEKNKYWDENSPIVKSKLAEILKDKENLTDLEKAREIDKYVSNFLRFDYSRIEKGDFTRFGSLTSLNNPEKALSAEFVDLEIAMLRAAGIPARQVIGFSLAQDSRPFSYQNNSLHTWVEIYNGQLGWITSDPTWQNTTQGTVLFNFNDLTHLGLTYGSSDNDFILPIKAEAKIFEGEIQEKKAAELDVQVDSEILAGFPSKIKVKINNLGNTIFPASELQIDASKILLEGNGREPSITTLITTPEIAPFGNIEYDFNLKTGAIWHSYQDILQVKFAGVTDTRVISVNPILSYKIFAIEIFGGLTMIALFYVLVLLIHHKSAKNSH